jgi:FAD/FMN-containing dehydrogenase
MRTNLPTHHATTQASQAGLKRRAFVGGLAGAAMVSMTQTHATCPIDPLSICNVTHLYSVPMKKIVVVRDADDVRSALRRWSGRVSIGGARFSSMGGQTAIRDGMQLDMREMQHLIWLNPVEKIVRVQAGMSWRALQSLLDPYGLAVQTMQSYSNFSVGGSVSVNCHGRYVGHGPIVSSVRALQIVMADGEVLDASPTQQNEIFYAAIGGYGGVGVITEVELALDENFRIERVSSNVPLEGYVSWFKQTLASDSAVLLHNADLVPPHFDQPHCVTWRRSGKRLTQEQHLRPTNRHYFAEKTAIWAMTELPGGHSMRKGIVQPLQNTPAVVWRNYEASLDVAELEPATRATSTYVLQEYFIPERNFLSFAKQMAHLMRRTVTGVLNVSIRHSPSDRHTLMSWAAEDVFSFVVYYKQGITAKDQQMVGDWTRAIIALALQHDGRYYLPYQLHATKEQFAQAYPKAASFKLLRKNAGAHRLSNSQWDKYGI